MSVINCLYENWTGKDKSFGPFLAYKTHISFYSGIKQEKIKTLMCTEIILHCVSGDIKPRAGPSTELREYSFPGNVKWFIFVP